MDYPEAEKSIRKVVDGCADCDVCRFLMDSNCLLFPELYRLYDREMETGAQITSSELRNLVRLCNFCALCPCPDVRADILRAKTLFVDREGLSFGLRTLQDVELIGKLCGVFPKLSRKLLRNRFAGKMVKNALGIHEDRLLPAFPDESFPAWAKKKNLHNRKDSNGKRKVAYFAGCTGRYLFPEVPKAVVHVLEKNEIEVCYPEQKCCGMPTLLEGDRKKTLDFVRYNAESLGRAVQDGFDIVCSCPTCGFMLRNILADGAYYSAEYQESVGADEGFIKVPSRSGSDAVKKRPFEMLRKSIYGSLLKDDGYFSSIRPRLRIGVAEHVFDVGEYLLALHKAGELKGFSPLSGDLAYYPPCHLREQKIGRPYMDLMALIPGLHPRQIEGDLNCCGIAGIMGFKREFHDASIQLGVRLMEKIRRMDPQRLVTDCLSCRLQFNQLLPHRVLHPIEILDEAYAK